MGPREHTARGFLRGLVRFVLLVAVAGGLGVGLGVGLVAVSDDVGPSGTPVADGGADSDTTATTATGTTGRRTTTTPRPTTSTPTGTLGAKPPATTTTTAPATTTTPSGGPLPQVGLRILGAILHPASSPDGIARRRARLTARVRAINRSGVPVTIPRPVLAVGKVRIRTDSAAETDATRFGELAIGENKSVTLRFELQGEATEKITIDRRARLTIAGRSMAFRLKIGPPVKPPTASDSTTTTQTTP